MFQIFLLFGHVAALSGLARATSVEIPCKNPGTPATACKLFSSPCESTVQSMVTDIDRTIQAKLDGIAAGRDLSLFQVDSNGQPLENPTSVSCELLVTPPEVTTNRLGRSCGHTATITANGADLTDAPAENAYKVGAAVSSIKCFWNTAKFELQNQGRINNIPAACQGLADDAAAVIAQSDTAWNTLVERENAASGTRNLCSAKMIRDFQTMGVPETCRDDLAPTSDEEVAQVVNTRQGACFLAASRTALYTALKHLTLCTVFKRSELSWRKIFEGVDNPFDAMLAQDYVPALVSYTRGRVRSGCRPFYRRSCIRNKIRSAASAYQRDHYWEAVRSLLAPKYPINAPQGGACFE